MLNVNINSVSIISKDSKRILLKNLKFDIEKGKIYTILGKNGSGKSTLVKALSSLLPVLEYEVLGNVFFDGTDITKTSGENLRIIRKNNIRYVFQDVANSLDPLKKLKYYFKLSESIPQQIEQHLDFFLLPPYKKLSEMFPYELSGGMTQRILIVLALLANPDLLILDEPTSGVDYAVANLIHLKLKDFIKTKDKSVLIVTQDINFAIKSSDYITYLSDGTLSQFFHANNLINSPDNKMKNLIDSFKEIANVST